MSESTMQLKLHEEIEKFKKTMEEIQLLKSASQDIRKYKKLIKYKKYD